MKGYSRAARPEKPKERVRGLSETTVRAPRDAVILIPSLEPDGRLPAYVEKLTESGFGHVVVIDDGSGESYRPIFDTLSRMENVQVLRHEVNRGKGVALKTGR